MLACTIHKETIRKQLELNRIRYDHLLKTIKQTLAQCHFLHDFPRKSPRAIQSHLVGLANGFVVSPSKIFELGMAAGNQEIGNLLRQLSPTVEQPDHFGFTSNFFAFVQPYRKLWILFSRGVGDEQRRFFFACVLTQKIFRFPDGISYLYGKAHKEQIETIGAFDFGECEDLFIPGDFFENASRDSLGVTCLRDIGNECPHEITSYKNETPHECQFGVCPYI